MLSLEDCRKIDPELNNISDQELEAIRDCLYGLGNLAIEDWIRENSGSNFPLGLLQKNK